jgi:hypothetical protein
VRRRKCGCATVGVALGEHLEKVFFKGVFETAVRLVFAGDAL